MDILVVDDDPICLKVLNLMLSKKNYNVVSAKSGSEAKRILSNQNIDLILTDLGLPDVDGFELVDYFCKLKENIPVIVISGHIVEDTSKDLMDMGVTKLLEKPVYVHQIDEALAEVA